MASFPPMSELPACADTSGWVWQRVDKPCHPSDGFWIGNDGRGNHWLTKLRGSFYAYREILFGRLAQAMNWSCQSSMFIRLDRGSAEILGRQAGEIHAAHWHMNEHPGRSCGTACALEPLIGREMRTIEDLQPHKIRHLRDWPKSVFAAYVFGGNEPSGMFITTQHEFVIIDSDQMFSSGPASFDSVSWLTQPDGLPSKSGKALCIEVCSEVSNLSPTLVSQALAVPSGVSIKFSWPVEPNLRKSIEFASAYARLHTGA